MRPVGTTTVDSTVADFKASSEQGEDDGDKGPGGGVEMVGDREGAEEFYDGDTEVSSQCCGGLSPTTIVYMSAFVSSLTSVLLGYGECEGDRVCAPGHCTAAAAVVILCVVYLFICVDTYTWYISYAVRRHHCCLWSCGPAAGLWRAWQHVPSQCIYCTAVLVLDVQHNDEG